MRNRAIIHIAGPNESGKTAFIEALLRAGVAEFAICVRGVHDPKLHRERESAPKSHAELRRYREAGAEGVALYRFPEPDWEGFFESDVMQDFSDAVFIEGDCPIGGVDLNVFITRAPQAAFSLLRRELRDHTAEHEAEFARYEKAIESPRAMLEMAFGESGGAIAAMMKRSSPRTDSMMAGLRDKLDEMRRLPLPPPTEHWAVAEGYEGIERAGLVVVNKRQGDDLAHAKALAREVPRLRKEEDVFRDVIGILGNKLPVTVTDADLRNPNDAGLKKAITRVRRTVKRMRDIDRG